MDNIKILDRIIYVQPVVKVIDGRFTISNENELGITKGTLPPRDLASLPSMQIIPKEAIREGKRLRSAVKKLACRLSLGGLGAFGYAMSLERYELFLKEAKLLEDEFISWRADFISNFDNLVDKWVSENSDYKALLQKRRRSSESIAQNINWTIHVAKINQPGNLQTGANAASVESVGANLVGSLFSSISISVGLKISEIKEKEMATSRGMKKFMNTTIEKLEHYEFLSARTRVLKDLLTQLAVSIQDKYMSACVTSLEGSDAKWVASCLLFFSSADNLLQVTDKEFDITTLAFIKNQQSSDAGLFASLT